MRSLILRTATRALLPLLLLFSLFILLRGHNEPGGGFIGGLLAAGGLSLYTLAYDAEAAARLLRIDPRVLIGGGLLVAALSGCVAVFRGNAFLTGVWVAEPVPGIGKVSTVLLFDVGVYLVVLGTTMLMILMLARPEEEES
jgi:multicomponent Na+:H+ antiporter subunit B